MPPFGMLHVNRQLLSHFFAISINTQKGTFLISYHLVHYLFNHHNNLSLDFPKSAKIEFIITFFFNFSEFCNFNGQFLSLFSPINQCIQYINQISLKHPATSQQLPIILKQVFPSISQIFFQHASIKLHMFKIIFECLRLYAFSPLNYSFRPKSSNFAPNSPHDPYLPPHQITPKCFFGTSKDLGASCFHHRFFQKIQ